MRKKHRYNKWKDGWEKIEPSKVPRWVLYSGVQPDYFQCVELKGKHYRYLICSEPGLCQAIRKEACEDRQGGCQSVSAVVISLIKSGYVYV